MRSGDFPTAKGFYNDSAYFAHRAVGQLGERAEAEAEVVETRPAVDNRALVGVLLGVVLMILATLGPFIATATSEGASEGSSFRQFAYVLLLGAVLVWAAPWRRAINILPCLRHCAGAGLVLAQPWLGDRTGHRLPPPVTDHLCDLVRLHSGALQWLSPKPECLAHCNGDRFGDQFPGGLV
jgi:protein-S-isoprenylcysteine O-methyltransferase Ste14